ncbi:unnamed protein product, partial [Amoebophrya sp. A25]
EGRGWIQLPPKMFPDRLASHSEKRQQRRGDEAKAVAQQRERGQRPHLHAATDRQRLPEQGRRGGQPPKQKGRHSGAGKHLAGGERRKKRSERQRQGPEGKGHEGQRRQEGRRRPTQGTQQSARTKPGKRAAANRQQRRRQAEPNKTTSEKRNGRTPR